MKYEYQIINQALAESNEEFMERLNDWGKRGWRFISETYTDGEYQLGRILLEKTL